MTYQGFYINLDRSTERRAEIEAELARHNLSKCYTRFSAVAGNPHGLRSPLPHASEVGCFLSHVAALKEGMKMGQHLHIIEDDTIFAGCFAQTVDRVTTSGMMDGIDILYTDIGLPYENNVYGRMKALSDRAVVRGADGKVQRADFQIVNLKDIEFTCTSSYLVNKNSLAKLAALYDAEIAEGVRAPIDAFLRLQTQAGAITSGCLFPFLTSVKVEHTTTSTVRATDDMTGKLIAANIGRYSFFIDCDWNECERLMDAYTKPLPAHDRHAQMLAKLLAFSLISEETPVAPPKAALP